MLTNNIVFVIIFVFDKYLHRDLFCPIENKIMIFFKKSLENKNIENTENHFNI